MRISVIGLAAAFCLCATAWAGGQKGLLAHWDFDEGKGDVLHDRSGNNNHGTIHGATWVKCGLGRQGRQGDQGGKGYALKFDGSGEYRVAAK